jgi:hypothetical protein
MPMQKISTLIYCINSFQNDCDQHKIAVNGNELDTLKTSKWMEPSESSIKNILNFARSYDAIETKSTGYVDMILN